MGNHMFFQALTSIVAVFVLAVAPMLSIVFSVTAVSAQPYDSIPNIAITELQTRSVDDPHVEFIELYNSTNQIIDLADWQLEYKPATGTSWSSKIRGSQYVEPRYKINPGEFYVLATENFSQAYDDILVGQTLSSGSAEGGGHIRLLEPVFIDDSEEVFEEADRVAWGSAVYIPDGTAPAVAPGQSHSIYRCFIGDELQATDDNSVDFLESEVPQPGFGYDCPMNESENDELSEPPADDSDEELADEEKDDEQQESGSSKKDNNVDSDAADSDGEAPAKDEEADEDENEANDDSDKSEVATCSDSIVLSELLPNPAGPRSEFPRDTHAYIELHNTSNDTVSLFGCHLQTSNANTVYSFDDEVMLEPHEYKVFYPEQTNVYLPVSPSGTVFLLSGDDMDDLEEQQEVTYEAGMPEAASYAWLGEEEWVITYKVSPNQQNSLLEVRPCDDSDQERHPDTGRCRNIITASSTADLVPCGPGRERNPETNRCRNIQNTERQLVPCGPGQERNPETNRCRSINAGQRQLVPCGPGQERNPETNRCRTVAQPNSDQIEVEDIRVAVEQDRSHVMLSGLFFGAALSYGVWEWRREVRRLWQRVTRQLSRLR